MKNGERLSLEQVRAFLKASEEFRFEASKRKEVYDWVTRTLVEHEYHGRFSPGAHSPWKSLRDSHIPTVATKQWKWKTKNRFSHFPLPRVGSSDQIQKGGLAAELRSSSRLIVRLENAICAHQSVPRK